MKILVLDNYDSFTYNLVHIIRELGYGRQTDVVRNDQISIRDVNKYDKILLSPGPGIPSVAGILIDLIKIYASSKSILGVCLGHQAICEVFGGKLINMSVVLHGIGRKTHVIDTGDYLFDNVAQTFTAGRYHSWVADKSSIHFPLAVTAIGEDGHVMAVKHHELDVRGVQFHPESILTEGGKQIISNWLKSKHQLEHSLNFSNGHYYLEEDTAAI